MHYMTLRQLTERRNAVLPKLVRYQRELNEDSHWFQEYRTSLVEQQTPEYPQALKRFAAAERAMNSHPHDLDVQDEYRAAEKDKERIDGNAFASLAKNGEYQARASANINRIQQRAEIEEQLEALRKLPKTIKDAETVLQKQGVSFVFEAHESRETGEITSALNEARLLRAAGKQLALDVDEVRFVREQGATHEEVGPELHHRHSV